MRNTIQVTSFDKQVDEANKTQKLIFYLKAPRYVWLTDNKLVLEYPIKFMLTNIGEAALFSLLPLAYHEACNIEFPQNLAIEENSLERIEKICGLWNKWFRFNRKVKVATDFFDSQDTTPGHRVGAQLFSGGVDSLTTFKRQRDNIKYLVFYKGADIPLSNPQLFAIINASLRDFSNEQNKEFIILTTNTHYLSCVSWEYLAHACAMIGPLLALSNYINIIYIASSNPLPCATKIPLGSHPDLDPLISTESVKVVHDGAELTKPQKIKFISSEPYLLKQVRVCNNAKYLNSHYNKNFPYFNCGICEKCLRTTTILTTLNLSPDHIPFPFDSLKVERIVNFLKNCNLSWGSKIDWAQNLEFLLSSESVKKNSNMITDLLKKKLGIFFDEYLKNFPGGIPPRFKSGWNQIERRFYLKADALLWLKKNYSFSKR